MSEQNSSPVLTERRDNVLAHHSEPARGPQRGQQALADGVAAALDELDADDALAIGVLTGAGGGFCSGMDLKAFAAGERLGTPSAASPGSSSSRRASRSSPRSRASPSPAGSRSRWRAT